MAKGRIPFISYSSLVILRWFDSNKQKVYTADELLSVFHNNQVAWRLPTRMSGKKFIKFLKEKGQLQEVIITYCKNEKKITRYTWKEVSPMEIAISIKRGSYISHMSAAIVHGLSNQTSHRIFVNLEQTPKIENSASKLSQHGIKLAFSRPQRQTTNILKFKDHEIVLLNGKHTGNLEVSSLISDNISLLVTKLERTLIDMTVRPAYSSGVYQILEAFERAKERIRIPVLVATLKKLNYAYPYHQAIGFYLQRAGYSEQQWQQLRYEEFLFDFYLAHDIREQEYDSFWKIFYPKGF